MALALGAGVFDDRARHVDPDLPCDFARHPRGVGSEDRALVEAPARARIGLADLLDHLDVRRQVDLAAADRAWDRHVEQASVRHRLEQRPRQLPLLLDLVGGGADLRDELPCGVQQRAAVGVQGGSSGLGAARDERGLLDVEVQAAVGERLIAEDEHGVLVHAGADLGERLRIVDGAKLHRAHLGHEQRVELPEGQHGL